MNNEDVSEKFKELETTPERLAVRLGLARGSMAAWLRYQQVPRSRKRRALIAEALGLPVKTIWPNAN